MPEEEEELPPRFLTCFLSLLLLPRDDLLPFFCLFFELFLLCFEEDLFVTTCDTEVGIGSYTSGAHFTVNFTGGVTPLFSRLPFIADTGFEWA
ncbi:hypothetical protein HanPSC8_Chr14g0630901 [Helianthus annuus]|nr:hypothetical protein HanPSC8_Chr14g0630901 [Helianthus annuus]